MDAFSYLLGKKAGGGGSQNPYNAKIEKVGGITYQITKEIGQYLSEIQDMPDFTVTDARNLFSGYAGLKKAPQLNTNGVQNFQNMFTNCKSLEEVPLYNMNSARNCSNMFNYCQKLENIPLFNTQYVTSFAGMFSYSGLKTCPTLNTLRGTDFNSMFRETKLITAPSLNTSLGTDLSYMFFACSSLENVPVFNWRKVTDLSNIFGGCSKLTDNSISNILQSCISATSYTGTKTLRVLGFSANNIEATRIQDAPNYQDFVNAGWSIGY